MPSVTAFKGRKQAVLLIPPRPSPPPLSPCAWDAKKHLASGAFQSSLSAPGPPGHSRGHRAGREPRVDVATATLCFRQKCLWGLVRKQESVPEEGKTPHGRHGQHLEPGAWSLKSGAGSPGALEPGARSQEPRARSQEPGARSQKPGTQSQEPGARSLEPGARSPEPGGRSPRARSQEPGARSQGPRAIEPGAWSPEPGARSQEPGARGLEPGAWGLGPGTGIQEPGAGSQEP